MIAGEQLQELLRTEMWRDHFTALSERLGFSLSVYSQSGTLIMAPPGPFPLCPAFSSASSSFNAHCDAQCLTRALNTLSTNKPDVFKCQAKIVSFALPIEYRGDKAVILGQGSFSSYNDFREYMNSVDAGDLDTVSIPLPTSFTTFEQAGKVCSFVADSVMRLLKNTQETASLREKFGRLKDFIAMCGTLDEERPETLYKHMISKLASLFDLAHVSIFIDEKKQGIFTNRVSLESGGGSRDLFSIIDHDTIVEDLIGGKAFVRASGPSGERGAGSLPGQADLYFFPITINKRLEGILYAAGRNLTEGDTQMIIAFCRQAALSIENQRLHQKLYGKFDRFAAIAELTKSITPIQNYNKLIRTILEQSISLLRAERGSLMLIDQESDDLLLEAQQGGRNGVVEKLRINRGEGIAGKVAEFGEPILVEDLEHDPRIMQKNRYHYKTRSFVSVPLKIDERIIGVLNLSDKISGEVFDEDDLKLIQSFVTQAAIVMERQHFINQTEELKKLTNTDPLTGLPNRRYLYERLKNELARADRHIRPLCLLMLDLDGFKACNDTMGHLFGDRILKNIADAVFHTVRSMDIVARYGGDEFMIILPETEEPLAMDIAERVRNNIRRQVALPRDASSEGPHTLTASIGIACFPEHGETVELLLENVDKALYRAKEKGKNRIEVFS
jgi:diguanylate cyclase (GGDEF)-like protein